MELYTKDLCVRFATRSGDIPAVNHVSLAFSERQVTGIIGETGSGKSVLGLSILGLLQSNASVTGQIFLGERELTALSERELCTVRGREIALVAQNPATSLNPSVRVGRQIEEVFRLAGKSTPDCRRLTLELLRQMAFSDPKQIAGAYPFELSGGMRQRVLTAIAVAARPQWLIADEPTKGLDAVVRNQVYDTFCMVRDQYRVGFIVITHDLLLARKFCERIVVMYCGRVLETNAARELFEHPRHPYTQGLIASLPHLGMKPMAGSRLYRPALRLRIPSPVPLRGGSLPAYRAEIHPLWRRERVLPSLRLKSSTSQKVFTPTAFADAPTRRWTMFPSPSGPDKLMG